MCRFILYLGHPLRLSQLITEPVHSLIQQSHHARERPDPLNGDGFGVAWFVPELSPRPALFKDVTPAWNNENLREVARVSQSQCILAHVRSASPQSAVHRLNCHPFAHENLAFMHNGFLAGFPRWRRQLLEELSDEAFQLILGSTDSEHAFALCWDRYRQSRVQDPLQRLRESVEGTIQELERLRCQAGVEEGSYFNFALSDGLHAVVTRCSTRGDESTASLHYATGREFQCTDGRLRLEPDDLDPDVVLVASEENGMNFCWRTVPPNHLLLARRPGQVEVLPIAASPLCAVSPGSRS